MPHRWDAATYDQLPLPHLQWGERAIARLHLRGNERVLDAGAGTGRVTEQLLERLPHGSVVALDASETMLAQLRQRMERYGDRVEVIQGDLRQPLPITEPVDAVLSTATLHWLPDHDVVFRHLAAVMQPAARLVVDCGGAGNIARVDTALREMGQERDEVWNFAGAEETRQRLEGAGFVEIETWLQADPAVLLPGEPFRTFLATVVLGAHLEGLTEEQQEEFVDEVARRLGEPVIDYVRLNIVARRAGKTPPRSRTASAADTTFGAVHSDQEPLSEEAIREAAWQHVAARDERSRSRLSMPTTPFPVVPEL